MSVSDVLSASWEKYDQKKLLARENKDIFCPEVLWEFNYLLDTIVKLRPDIDIIMVMLSIRKTMRETFAPRLREKFAAAVMQNLTEREVQLVELLNTSQRIAG